MKAIALISGGLDSILAARLIKEQGLEIIPLNFRIPFCNNSEGSSGKINSFIKKHLGTELKTLDISESFLELLHKPRHGFGSHMNPCIDCKILMLKETRKIMPEWGADFVVTGEVLGQRPMSQHRQALEVIARESGLDGLLLRPLCAQLLPETAPEREGWVSREKLLSFSGRTRKPQMALAEEFLIGDYANPAGGCLLTDAEFSKRLKEAMGHKEMSIENIELLKIGRHFRLAKDTKLVVARNEKECRRLESLAWPQDLLFYPNDELAGPTSLGRGKFSRELIELSCRITCRYCDLNGLKSAKIIYRNPADNTDSELQATPMEDGQLSALRV